MQPQEKKQEAGKKREEVRLGHSFSSLAAWSCGVSLERLYGITASREGQRFFIFVSNVDKLPLKETLKNQTSLNTEIIASITL